MSNQPHSSSAAIWSAETTLLRPDRTLVGVGLREGSGSSEPAFEFGQSSGLPAQLRSHDPAGNVGLAETDAFAALAVAHVIARQLARGADGQEG